MTDEGMGQQEDPTPMEGMGQHEDPAPMGEEMSRPTTRPAMAGTTDFTSGEGLVALAGMILLAVWLIFDVILDEYGLGLVTLLAAVVVVMVPRLDPATVAKVHSVPVIMKVVGYGLALIGVIDVIAAIEGGFFDDALEVIAALATYAAFGVAFVGARQIDI